ncbi:DUF4339 domain-containing protein [Bradyrhizobium sp. 26S5]|uniref:DUF4339 domain-containing protein n=1 Tax=Bradyrhizobium sp. 26S5 TaxID=3139729 RepID=UPI0030D4FBCD
MTDGQVMPPPLPRSETAAEWFVIKDGARLGPVTASAIRAMIGRKEIEADAQVWRSGMPEWKRIRDSELADLVAAEPPPISSMHIGSGYVWVLAFLPLVFCFIEASIAASNQQAAARTVRIGRRPLARPFLAEG